MVGGIIADLFIKEDRNDAYLIQFLVEDNKDFCTVHAEIPKDAIKHKMIQNGQSIWWQNPVVLIKIEETQDVQFKKIGCSGGDIESYKEDKKIFEIKP